MANINKQEQRQLEKALGMASGYVLDFSKEEFREFVLEHTGKDINDPKYIQDSESNADRLRVFWLAESNHTIAVLFKALIDEWDSWTTMQDPLHPSSDFLRITERLTVSAPAPDIWVVVPNAADKDFETVANEIRESIARDEPTAALERLYTFLRRYFKILSQKHKLVDKDNLSLYELVDLYVGHSRDNKSMKARIFDDVLRSSIAKFEDLHEVMNTQSFVNKKQILSKDEAMLILEHVASSIRFIESTRQTQTAQEMHSV
ncbi:hypothetical protein ISG33_11830 [Glaciecola sp. MH2013]|uniref:hypothetical protein n=1 Tax=Glaciecola sp. MH2013 TaxID=2785524 RepID=UPI00189DD14A|nr:hypothetical protein [Glaciecola sp. MH2013]MBF7074089.1 hypothetical protein [Glaciecola sp. MH2013]